MPRPSLKREDGGTAPVSSISFISSGCTVLDLMLGGGWPLGRIFNIVGDKSTGKTLLAIEACTNFSRLYPKGRLWYRESEAAFDPEYAASIGMPLSRISFVNRERQKFDTVEDFYDDLSTQSDLVLRKRVPGIYILDSLDALSDENEQQRGIDEKTFGGNKSKKMSELFRRSVRKLEQGDMTLGIISQVRANIGAAFGRKTTRSGGKALDFYASQIIYVSHIETLYKTVMGERLAYGVRVRVKCDKNKVGKAFRECEFPIHFSYGIEDLIASLEFLITTKRERDIKLTREGVERLIKQVPHMLVDEYEGYRRDVNRAVRCVWDERENSIRPIRRKYT